MNNPSMNNVSASPPSASRNADVSFRRDSGFAPTDPAIYYDLFVPTAPARKPAIVMIHGGGHTGTCFIHTPDGRPGWAPYFAAQGYTVIVPDWPGTGRSGAVAPDRLTGGLVCGAFGALLDSLGAPAILLTHSMSGPYGWKLVESHGDRIAALVAVAPGPPGNVQPPAEVIERGADHIDIRRGGSLRRVPLRAARLPEAAFVRDKLIGPGSRHFPIASVDHYARSLQALPPRLMYERQNIDGTQLRIKDPAPFRGRHILMVTGSDDVDHTRAIDGAIADWLHGMGANVEFTFLPDVGIAGNGHMLMLEENSDAIARLIGDWLDRRLG